MIFVQKLLCDTFDVTATAQYVRTSEFTLQGDVPIKTTGSSTTVDAVVASSAPFKYLDVNDILHVEVDNTVTTRTITAKASNDQVTVDAAVDWENGGAGRHFRWRNTEFASAPNTTAGLVNVSGWKDVVVYATQESYNFATNVTVTVEGIVAGGTTPVTLEDPQGNAAVITFTAVGSNSVPIGTAVDSLRVSLVGSGADGGLNNITVWVGGHIEAGRA